MELINETTVKNGYNKEIAIIDDMKADKYTLSYSSESISICSFLTMYTTSKDGSKSTIVVPVQFAGNNSIEIEFPKDTAILEIVYKGSTLNNLILSTVVTPYMEFIQEKATLWDKVQDIVNEQGKLRADMMEGIINLTMNAFANEGGTITQENGVMTFLNGATADESTQAVQITGGAIRIASNRKSDGSWNWQTALTGAGINADVINAGSLNGMFINGGQIEGTIIKGCQARFGVFGYAYTDIEASGDINSYYQPDGKTSVPTVRVRKAREGRIELGQNLNDNSKPCILIHSVSDIPFVSDSQVEQPPQGSLIDAGGEGLVIRHGDSYIVFWGGGIHIWPGGARLNIHGDVFIDGQLEVSGGIIDNAH